MDAAEGRAGLVAADDVAPSGTSTSNDRAPCQSPTVSSASENSTSADLDTAATVGSVALPSERLARRGGAQVGLRVVTGGVAVAPNAAGIVGYGVAAACERLNTYGKSPGNYGSPMSALR